MYIHQARAEAWLEEMKAWRKEKLACQEATEACLEKTKANSGKTKTGLEDMDAAVKTSLEQMKARMDCWRRWTQTEGPV
jgi:hypothetical protein